MLHSFRIFLDLRTKEIRSVIFYWKTAGALRASEWNKHWIKSNKRRLMTEHFCYAWVPLRKLTKCKCVFMRAIYNLMDACCRYCCCSDKRMKLNLMNEVISEKQPVFIDTNQIIKIIQNNSKKLLANGNLALISVVWKPKTIILIWWTIKLFNLILSKR